VISQELPPVPQVMRQVLRQARQGAIEVTVAADGSVESVALVTPSHFAYDSLLMAAARTWKYRPALRAGVPVPYKKLIRVIFTN
jgi:TonB family protein